MPFPINWDLSVGDGEARRDIINPIDGSGSLYLSVSAEDNVHLTIPEGPLQHGLLGAQYQFTLNIFSGTGLSGGIRSGLCFMCSTKDITLGTPNFYYVGLRLNVVDGSTHRLFLNKVSGATLYTLGSAIVPSVIGANDGYNQVYPLQMYWKKQGSNLILELKVGTALDYSDLVPVISVVDIGTFSTSTNESFFIKSETGVTSAVALIDNVIVKQVL